MAVKNIDLVRGDTLAFGVVCEGLSQDLDYAYMTCKENFDDSQMVFQKSIGDGVTKVSDYVYRVRVSPDDTEEVDPGEYYYDFVIWINGDRFTILSGVLNILPDVTRNEATA